MREPRTDWSTTSFSELSLLARCEEEWYLKYALRREGTTGKKAALGIALHAAQAELWVPGDPMDKAARAVAAGRAALLAEKVELDDTFTADYEWLMKRYTDHYGEDFAQVEAVEGAEMELVAEIKVGGVTFVVKAKIDQLLVIGGRIILVERKTSGNKSALESAAVAPQFTLYWWLLQENGYDPHQLWLDHTYTYHWKPTQPSLKDLAAEGVPPADRKIVQAQRQIERPTAESFTLLRMDRTDMQVERALEWARQILMRRQQLVSDGNLISPIRNLGSNCGRCDFRRECWAGLSFDAEPEFVAVP